MAFTLTIEIMALTLIELRPLLQTYVCDIRISSQEVFFLSYTPQHNSALNNVHAQQSVCPSRSPVFLPNILAVGGKLYTPL